MTKYLRNIGVHIISFLLVFTLMSPNATMNIQATTELQPGEIALSKTAKPTPGKVNTWDITVDFASRNHEMTSDIVLVMDVSGSMSSNEKLVKTKAAATKFVENLLTPGDTRTRISLVTYSNNSMKVLDFQGYSGRAVLLSSIAGLTAGGGTNTQSGLRTARETMATSTADIKSIILLSDGEPTLSYALTTTPPPDSYLVQYDEDYKETKRGIPVSAYNTSVIAGNGSQTFRSRCLYDGNQNNNCGTRQDFYFNHGNAALNEADEAKKAPQNYIIYTIALELTGNAASTFMKAVATSEGHAFTATAGNIDTIYTEIAGGIKNNTSNAIVTDPIAPGFELVPGTLATNKGTATGGSPIITWKIGDPTEEYFIGQMTYQVRAVDSILGVSSSDGLYATNGRTYLSYKDNTGATKEKDYVVPRVKPTFLSLEKILKDDLKDTINDGGYLFEVNTKGPGTFDRTDQIKPGSAHKVKTVEIYDYGTYTVQEKSATLNGVNVPLASYNTVININGTDTSTFTLDDNNRADVSVIVNNTDLRTAQLKGLKSISDASGDGHAERGEVIHYSLTLQNTGNGRARGVMIQDTLSDLLAYMDNSFTTVVKLFKDSETEAFATYTREQLIAGFTVDMAPNSTVRADFSIQLKADFDGQLAGTIRNLAIVGPDTPGTEIPTKYPIIESSKEMTNFTDPSKAYVEPGESVEVVINVANIGTSKDQLTVVDALTDMLPYIEDPTSVVLTYVKNGNVTSTSTVGALMDGSFNLELMPNDSYRLRFVVKVLTNFEVTEGLELRNVAVVGGKDVETEIPVKAPKIVGSKTAKEASGDGYVQSGEMIHYTITATNTGTANAPAVLIRDQLLDLKPYVIVDGTKAITTTRDTYTLQHLMDGFNVFIQPGEEFKVEFTLQAKADLDALIGDKLNLTNVAMVGDEEHPASLPVGDYGVDGRKLVRGEHFANMVMAGDKLFYTIEVWNTKDLTTEAVVTDTLSQLLAYVEAHDTNALTITSNQDYEYAGYTVANLKNGITFDVHKNEKITLEFELKTLTTLTKEQIKILNNTVSINNEDRDASIPLGERSFTVNKSVLSKHESTMAVPGYGLDYEVIVTNTGDAGYDALVIKDTLSNILTLVDAPALNPVVLTISDVAGTVELTVQDLIDGHTFALNKGAIASFKFSLKVKADLDVTVHKNLANTVTVNNTPAQANIATAQENLFVNKSVLDFNEDGYANSGERLDYTINFGNDGNLLAKGVVLKDTLEGLLPFVVDDLSKQVTLVSSEHGTMAPYTLQNLVDGITLDLKAGERLTLNFSLTLKDDAVDKVQALDMNTLTNTVTLDEETDKVVIPVGDYGLDASKAVVGSQYDHLILAGDKLLYTVVIWNTKDLKIEKVLIKDTLDQLLSFVDPHDTNPLVITSSGSQEFGNYTVADLKAGFEVSLDVNERIIITFEVQSKASLVKGDLVSFHNTVSVNDIDRNASIPFGTKSLTIDKEVSSEHESGFAVPGFDVYYDIIVENTGDVPYLGVKVIDGLEFIHAMIDDPTDTIITVTSNDLPIPGLITVGEMMTGYTFDIDPGEVITFSFPVHVNEKLVVSPEDFMHNVARVNELPAEANIELRNTNFFVDKLVSDENGDGVGSSGETLDYTINFGNTGTLEAKDAVVRDTLVNLLPFISDELSEKITLTSSVRGVLAPYTLQNLVDGITLDVAAGETFILDFSVTLNADAVDEMHKIDVDSITNIATFGGKISEIVTPVGDYGFDGSKKVVGSQFDKLILAGDTLHYTIELWNTEDLKFDEILIKDTLDQILAFVDPHDTTPLVITTTGMQEFGDYTVADLKAGFTLPLYRGERITITFDLVSKDTLVKGDLVSFDNTVTFDELERDASIPFGTKSLAIEKNATSQHESGFAVPGFDLNYEIVVNNTGDVSYLDIEVLDDLDAILELIEDPSANVLTVTSNKSEVPVYASVADLMTGYTFSIMPGEVLKFSFSVSVREELLVEPEDMMRNTAYVNDVPVKEEIELRDTDLFIEKFVKDFNGDGFGNSGEKLTYSIAIRNTGTLDAEDLMVRDTLEALLPYLKDTSATQVVYTSSIAGNNQTYTLAQLIAGISVNLDAGERGTFVFEVTLKDDAVATLHSKEMSYFRNTATLDEIPTEVEIPGLDPVLVKDKIVKDHNKDGFAEAGELLYYEIRVQNTSAATADRVRVVDTLEDILAYIEDPSDVIVHVHSNHASEEISINDLKNGYETKLMGNDTLSITFTLTVRYDLKDILKADTVLRNTAMINDTEVEVKIPTLLPKLVAKKTVVDANKDGRAQKGEVLTYNITVTNSGAVKALGINIKDDLKHLKGLADIDLKQKLRLNGEEVLFTLEDLGKGLKLDLAAGATLVIEFELKVSDALDFSVEHIFRNIATVDDVEVKAEIPSLVVKVVPVVPQLPQTGVSNTALYTVVVAMLVMGGILFVRFGLFKKED